MPSPINVLACTAVAFLFWGVGGYAISRRLAPAGLALALAPALGWAVHSAVALPFYRYVGFTTGIVAAGSIAVLTGALFQLRLPPSSEDGGRVPLAAYGLAALLAAVPAIALFPKVSGDTIALSSAIFDHSKIAMIDEMTRLGLPPGNPFVGEAGHNSPLAYYYLWHFSAAELALIPGVNGWEADIALTAFTAFSSISLMMGFAVWISGRASAGIWVAPLAFAAALHPVLEFIVGSETFYATILPPTGLAGWLFQTTWAPQHIASSSCVLLCVFLLTQRPSWLGVIVLALTAVAGYESSTWVGGILFAAAALVVGVILMTDTPPAERLRLVMRSTIAALLAIILAFPFLHDQFFNAATRSAGSPITLYHYRVFGILVPDDLRSILDFPGYWLVLLVIEFPAIYIPGLVALIGSVRSTLLPSPIRLASKAFLGLALTSLFVTGYLTITFVSNNDLGWRAVLPGVCVLTIFAASGLSRWLSSPAPLAAGCALLLLALGLPKAFQLVGEDLRGTVSESDRAFSKTPALWDAVRQHTAPAERVANNPSFMAEMTPWPVNISWALFANRRSCFAGWNLVLPFSSLPRRRVDDLYEQFRRVFDGDGNESDVADMAARSQCRVVVLTAQDGAWQHDLFATSALYRLAEEKPGRWKIYRAIDPPGQSASRP